LVNPNARRLADDQQARRGASANDRARTQRQMFCALITAPDFGKQPSEIVVTRRARCAS
jgi:hypothetical protein